MIAAWIAKITEKSSALAAIKENNFSASRNDRWCRLQLHGDLLK